MSTATFIFSKGAIILISMLASHTLDEQHFAQLNAVLTILASFANVVGAGWGLAATKYIAQDGGLSSQKARRSVSFLFYCTAFSATIAVPLLAELVSALNTGSTSLFFDLAACALVVGNIYFGYFSGIALGHSDIQMLARIALVQGVFGLSLSLAACSTKSLEMFLLALSGAQILGVALLVFAIRRYIPLSELISGRLRDIFSNAAPASRIAVPSMLAGLVFLPAGWLVITEISDHSLLLDVSVFSIANQWRNSAMTIPSIVGAVVLPMLARGEDHHPEANTINFRLSYIMTFIVVAPFIAIPEWLLLPFGADYRTFDSAFCVQLMMISALIGSFKAAISRHFITRELGYTSILSNASWLVLFLALFYSGEKTAVGACSAFLYSQVIHMAVWMPYYITNGFIEHKTLEPAVFLSVAGSFC